ncbi:aspartate racemase [Sporosarcina luteola]|nr:aspartate racemase [Sporosarcina luteola]
MTKMKHVGLIGVSAVGAALCYQELVITCMRRYGTHPEITLHNMPIHLFSNQELSKTGEVLLSSLTSLKNAGAAFAALTANTTHYAVTTIEDRIPLPLLDIVDLTVDECRDAEYKKVAVLGTFVTMQFGLYEKKLGQMGIELIQPSLEEQEEVDRIISEELQEGIVKKSSKDYICALAGRLMDKQAEAIILACTELPLIQFDDASFCFVNPNELLVEEIIRNAILIDGMEEPSETSKPERPSGKFERTTSFFEYPQQTAISEVLQKGIDALNADQFDEALQFFNEAVIRDPNDPEAYSWIAISLGSKMETSNALLKVKLLPRFEQAVQKCIELEPDSLIVRRLVGTRFIKIPKEFGGDLKRGIAELEHCVANGLDDPEIHRLLGFTYLQLGDIEKSEKALQQAEQAYVFK